jgi:hypothetical protein
MLNKKLLLKEFELIKKNRVVSIFWIIKTNARAKRIMYLEKIGAIVRQRQARADAYPNCVFEIHEQRLTMLATDKWQAVVVKDNLGSANCG